MKFTIYQASRQGGRKSNQDRVAYSYSRDALLMVVADGMGGHMHGEIAAQLCVQTLTSHFQQKAKPRLPEPRDFLLKTIEQAHFAINDYAVEHNLLEIPHTTCVAALIQDNTAYWAHVGDSRLYYFCNGQLKARTEDHTAVARMIRDGLIDEEEALHHPDRNKVSNCLGGYIVPEIELSVPHTIRDTDTFLLCTDGVWASLGLQEISAILHAYELEDAVRHLMDHAEFRGGESGDNLSLVAMTWGDPRRPGVEAISTLSLPEHGFTTLINNPLAEQPHQNISDEEIEKAILEIQSAIRKLSK